MLVFLNTKNIIRFQCFSCFFKLQTSNNLSCSMFFFFFQSPHFEQPTFVNYLPTSYAFWGACTTTRRPGCCLGAFKVRRPYTKQCFLCSGNLTPPPYIFLSQYLLYILFGPPLLPPTYSLLNDYLKLIEIPSGASPPPVPIPCSLPIKSWEKSSL